MTLYTDITLQRSIAPESYSLDTRRRQSVNFIGHKPRQSTAIRLTWPYKSNRTLLNRRQRATRTVDRLWNNSETMFTTATVT